MLFMLIIWKIEYFARFCEKLTSPSRTKPRNHVHAQTMSSLAMIAAFFNRIKRCLPLATRFDLFMDPMG